MNNVITIDTLMARRSPCLPRMLLWWARRSARMTEEIAARAIAKWEKDQCV